MNYKINKIEPMAKNTKEELYRYLADVATVVKDEEIKNPEKLFERLSKESFGNKGSSVLAFVPIILGLELNDFNFLRNTGFRQLFGFFKDGKYHTNLREILNNGYSLDEAIELIDFTYYKTFTAVVPNFVYAQNRTHGQVQALQQSNRRSRSKYGYYKPSEVDMTNEQWNVRVRNSTPNNLEEFLRVGCGIKRQELYARGADMLEIRKFSIGVNTLNPNSWEHLKGERTASGTQKETREFMSEFLKHVDK